MSYLDPGSSALNAGRPGGNSNKLRMNQALPREYKRPWRCIDLRAVSRPPLKGWTQIKMRLDQQRPVRQASWLTTSISSKSPKTTDRVRTAQCHSWADAPSPYPASQVLVTTGATKGIPQVYLERRIHPSTPYGDKTKSHITNIPQHHSRILLISILNSKQNLHPQTTPPTTHNNLPMFRLPLQILLRNQEPPFISTTTPSIPQRSVRITLIARQILQIHNLQTRMKNRACLLPLRDPCAIESQRPIVFSA